MKRLNWNFIKIILILSEFFFIDYTCKHGADSADKGIIRQGYTRKFLQILYKKRKRKKVSSNSLPSTFLSCVLSSDYSPTTLGIH